MSEKTNLYKWIRTNWEAIWGHGTYVCAEDGREEQKGFYVVVGLDVLAEHLGCSEKDLIYGVEE